MSQKRGGVGKNEIGSSGKSKLDKDRIPKWVQRTSQFYNNDELEPNQREFTEKGESTLTDSGKPDKKSYLNTDTVHVFSSIPDHHTLKVRYDIAGHNEEAHNLIVQVQEDNHISIGHIQFVGIPKTEFADVLDVDVRTLNRHLSEDKPLKRYQVESITYIIAAMEKIRNFFGDKAKVERWMNRPNVAFNNVKPKELLKTVTGCQTLIDFIGQMQHGVMV